MHLKSKPQVTETDHVTYSSYYEKNHEWLKTNLKDIEKLS